MSSDPKKPFDAAPNATPDLLQQDLSLDRRANRRVPTFTELQAVQVPPPPPPSAVAPPNLQRRAPPSPQQFAEQRVMPPPPPPMSVPTPATRPPPAPAPLQLAPQAAVFRPSVDLPPVPPQAPRTSATTMKLPSFSPQAEQTPAVAPQPTHARPVAQLPAPQRPVSAAPAFAAQPSPASAAPAFAAQPRPVSAPQPDARTQAPAPQRPVSASPTFAAQPSPVSAPQPEVRTQSPAAQQRPGSSLSDARTQQPAFASQPPSDSRTPHAPAFAAQPRPVSSPSDARTQQPAFAAQPLSDSRTPHAHEPAFAAQLRPAVAPHSDALPAASVAPRAPHAVRAEPAALWRRAGAWLVDLAFIAVLVGGFLFIATSVIAPKHLTLAQQLSLVALPGAALAGMLAFVYTTLFAFLWNGRTPGRRALGIHLVDTSGHAPGPMRALTRAGLSLVSFGLFLAGFWLALFDRHGQTLHDKLTRTFVVRLSGA